MHHRPEHLKGFTLLEVLVALTIFMLIGTGAAGMLHAVVKAREVQQAHSAAFAQLQRAMWMLEQDFAQSRPASIREGENAGLQRIGRRNPMGLARSDVQEVRYSVVDGALVREYSAAGSAPGTQNLLERVKSFSVRKMNARAVEVLLDTEAAGDIRRVIEVPES